MKKILIAAILAVAAIYGVGAFNLGEGGVNRFLNKHEEWFLNGDGDAYCDSLTDDMKYKIKDHTAKLIPGGKVDQAGGRQEMCDQFSETAAGMRLLQASTRLERHDFVVTRSWLHPWTANVSFTEYRTTSLGRGRVVLKTESDDQMVLVQTFSGVKIKWLESEGFMQED